MLYNYYYGEDADKSEERKKEGHSSQKRKIEQYPKGKSIIILEEMRVLMYTLEKDKIWKSTVLLEEWNACTMIEEIIYLFSKRTDPLAVSGGKYSGKGHLLAIALKKKASMKLRKTGIQVCLIHTGSLYAVGNCKDLSALCCEKYDIKNDKWSLAPTVDTKSNSFLLLCFQCRYLICAMMHGKPQKFCILDTLDEEASWKVHTIAQGKMYYNILYQANPCQIIMWNDCEECRCTIESEGEKLKECDKRTKQTWEKYYWNKPEKYLHNIATYSDYRYMMEKIYQVSI